MASISNYYIKWKFGLVVTIMVAETLISSPGNALSCSTNFPKILGGDPSTNSNTGDTYLYQIDIFQDYLALGGKLSSYSLTGTSSNVPYMAVLSVANCALLNWAKAFT
jgi:hypothetical protein